MSGNIKRKAAPYKGTNKYKDNIDNKLSNKKFIFLCCNKNFIFILFKENINKYIKIKKDKPYINRAV